MKMKRLFPGAAALALMFSAAGVLAAEPAEKAVADAIMATMKQAVPNVAPDRIIATPLAGLYEVSYGAQIYYVSKDGRYVIDGVMLDYKTRENLTDKSQSQARLAALGKLDEKSMIIYPAKGEKKHTVTVFTDIDCGYCRKLHNGMAQMNELGIEVRYLAFPRAGEKSPSYDKAVSVWCAENPSAAMNSAKQGEDPAPRKCDHNPISKHMQLAQIFGVNGTPSIVLENGRMLPGYLPPDRLFLELEKKGG